MAAQRCSLCSFDYPTNIQRCLICMERTWFLKSEDPPDDWRQQVKERKAKQQEDTQSMYPHRFDNKARIYEGKGNLWVTHAELLDAGYKSIEAGTILYLNETFYEVAGFAESAESWWIEEVPVEGVGESLEPAMFDGPA